MKNRIKKCPLPLERGFINLAVDYVGPFSKQISCFLGSSIGL
jgi:hypothetical protein